MPSIGAQCQCKCGSMPALNGCSRARPHNGGGRSCSGVWVTYTCPSSSGLPWVLWFWFWSTGSWTFASWSQAHCRPMRPRPRPHVWECKGATEIVRTLSVVPWFLFERVFLESSEIFGTSARVSWFCALPFGGRGNRGNRGTRGSIKEANKVTGQMRRDMSKKWQCRWSDGGEDVRVCRDSCAKPWSLTSPNASGA